MQFHSYIVLNQTRTSICELNLWDRGWGSIDTRLAKIRGCRPKQSADFHKAYIVMSEKLIYTHCVSKTL